MNRVLQVDNLSFSYPQQEAAEQAAEPAVFSEISFSLEQGGMITIFGEPESGKTTLTRLLGGLVPRYFGGRVTGTIQLATKTGNTDVLNTAPYQLLQDIGAVAQDPEEQIIMSECEDEILFPLENLGYDREEITTRLERALKRFDLVRYRHTNPSQLSGGEKKRLMLAVLYAVDPEIWVLDETFEELDSTWREAVLSLLKTEGKSVVLFASKYNTLHAEAADACGLLEPGNPDSDDLTFSTSEEFYEKLHGGIQQPAYMEEAPDYDIEPVCSCSDIRFSYHGEFTLSIDNLPFWEGESVALCGPNGSGKTTLSKILCGLLKPEAGRVLLHNGQKLAPVESRKLLRSVSYLFQNPDLQLFLPTVAEELSLGLHMAGLDKGEIAHRIQEAAELFHLDNLEAAPAVMGYGARKRLQAAINYLLDRDICIVDEMDSGLSYREFVDIAATLKKRAKVFILITHDMDLAKACAHRVIMMDSGTVVGQEYTCK
ncbi:MAG: ABC transporter ATP-binding protein [Spirochaetota bacterium]